MASAATEFLIGKIGEALEKEASSIAGVRDQVDEIKQELVSMKSFLEDAEGKKIDTEGEKEWVASIRNSVYDVEDIIDEFMYRMHELRNGGRLARLLCKTTLIPKNWYRSRFARWLRKTIHIPTRLQCRGRFVRWLRKCIQIPEYLWYRHQIAKKLQKITKTIREIPERKKRYGIIRVEGTGSNNICNRVQNQAESSLFVTEDELVGFEDKKNLLIGWLLNEVKHQIVVSVVGMGGSGKTTLVAKIFTDDAVKNHFECYAWITVSQSYVIEDLFRSLIKGFHQSRKEKVPGKLSSMSYRELLEILVNYLRFKRYVIVLDDVWNIQLLREIRVSLQDRQLGSRILLTTRKDDVAFHSFGVEILVHRIQPLENNESWELFSRKAFLTYHNKCCPAELKSLACELVAKCKGLPLAIVTLGGLMSSKKSSAEWREVCNNLNWHLTNDHSLEPVKSILLLSYNDLPYRLKHCFLYCCLFPEDHLIGRYRLVRLWIAEGFIEHVSGVTLEDLAERYLIELTFRSMLQFVKKDSQSRIPEQCIMHDLMREIALSTSEREKFGVVSDRRGVVKETRVRRLAIHTTEGEIESCPGMLQLRSLLVFPSGSSSPLLTNTWSSGFYLLRVLDLEYVPIEKLPDNLVYLFNLRYLNLRGTRIKRLPKYIGRLHNLQTLDISDTSVKILPSGSSKLINLRHLYMGHFNATGFETFICANGIRASSHISMFKKLQDLFFVRSDKNMIRLLRDMTQIRMLGITNIKESDEMELCASIQKLKILVWLNLSVSNSSEGFLRIDALVSPPPYLESLMLRGKLKMVPCWFCSLECLTHIDLRWCRLEEDLLPHIEALPCLERILLDNAYVGKEMSFSRGFAKLTHLELFNFRVLNTLSIGKGVMPNLQYLGLRSCKKLKTLPHGLEYLAHLEKLYMECVTRKLVESIREGGVDRPKVQHIRIIDHHYKTTSGLSYESLS
ncbi:disease resistance protein RPM1-like [Argentina anserina]|uniref:disease resistance protein RPM1-like n=1 Tax=Argentina anserina TaxID=57926 RepID=UPI00217636D3|nr:disease resistance protein RPM1-like [Potentilla anserina]XP_050364431.1 disease resistance protein RPM1-like [Potentilla anserina]XP_050364432.1 disease resistance protein RPM1-like [Potentilla anserina]